MTRRTDTPVNRCVPDASRLCLALLLLIGCSLPVQRVLAESSIVTLGTGGFTGVYYPAGGSICRLVNNTRADHGIRCSVRSSAGSVDNLQQVRAGELDMGIAQSDSIYQAYRGDEGFQAVGADQQLRTLFSLYPEYLTVVTRADSGIVEFSQLRGKRVSIGKPGTGQRSTIEVLMRQMGWDSDEFADAPQLDAAELARALCDGRIDVMIYAVGHPSGAIKEVTRNCASRLIEVAGPAVGQMVADNPYYHQAAVSGGLYAGNPEDVRTLGVYATFFASSRMSDDTAYALVKAVFENSALFRRSHPAFMGWDKRQMIRGPFSAPLHPGALRYYRDAGLIAR